MSPADASDASWNFSIDGNVVASGSYSDSGNWMYVYDKASDGHSTVMVVWPPTSPEDWVGCWDPNGKGGNREACKLPTSVVGEDQQFYAKLCIGESSTHHLLQCGAVHHIYR